MSAYIVSKATIDLLVSAGLSMPLGNMTWSKGPGVWDPVSLTHDNRNEVGQMLWAENLASIHARYPDTQEGGLYPGPVDFEATDVLTYMHEPVHGYEPVDVLSVLACYEYQSCEHKGWKTSEAHQFCDVLRKHAISKLPGYDHAPWGIDDVDYFRKRNLAKGA